jgi:hypothetical protein
MAAGVTSSTVTGVRISASKTRANKIPNRFNERADRDGHWGVEYGGLRLVLLFVFYDSRHVLTSRRVLTCLACLPVARLPPCSAFF